MNVNPVSPVQENPVMLYDGHCAFCNGAVQFVLRHEKEQKLFFAPLQSETGQALLGYFNLPLDNFKSFVVINNNRSYRRFEAALQLGYEMGGLWPRLTRILDVLIPDLIGNSIYSVLWPVRKVFGTYDQCMVPTKSMRARMLENIE